MMVDTSRENQDMRAAEYVLGTLTPDEVTRFERELPTDPALQEEVVYWEERLGQIGLGLPPVDPPSSAWATIQARVVAAAQRSGESTDKPLRPSPRSTAISPASLRWWRALAVAASVGCIVLAGFLYQALAPSTPAASPSYAGLFYDTDSRTGWIVSASTATDSMSVTAMGHYSLPRGKQLRMWVIPKGGQPIASGVVPAQGHNSWPMTARIKQLLGQPGTALAVSLESAGPPPADGPQGPVLWQSTVRQNTG